VSLSGRWALTPLLLLAGFTAAPRLFAQQTGATMRASVEVAAPPVLLENVRNLQFGSVSAGQVVSVNAEGPHAAGTISAGVRFSNIRKQDAQYYHFVLPAQLVRGSSSIPAVWNGTQFGSICVWSDNPATCIVPRIAFSPGAHTAATPLRVKLDTNTPGNHFGADVYLGGQINVPTTGVVPGVYTGTISVVITIGS
jgi:spore coat protein U-like protein